MQYRIITSNVKETGHFNADYTAIIQHGTPFEEVLNPMYWANVAKSMRQGDRIRLLAEDISYVAEAIVTAVSPQWAKIKIILPKTDLTDDVGESLPSAYDGFEVKFRGPHGRWSVIKKPDNVVLFEKAQDRAEAERWLDAHIEKIVRS